MRFPPPWVFESVEKSSANASSSQDSVVDLTILKPRRGSEKRRQYTTKFKAKATEYIEMKSPDATQESAAVCLSVRTSNVVETNLLSSEKQLTTNERHWCRGDMVQSMWIPMQNYWRGPNRRGPRQEWFIVNRLAIRCIGKKTCYNNVFKEVQRENANS